MWVADKLHLTLSLCCLVSQAREMTVSANFVDHHVMAAMWLKFVAWFMKRVVHALAPA